MIEMPLLVEVLNLLLFDVLLGHKYFGAGFNCESVLMIEICYLYPDSCSSFWRTSALESWSFYFAYSLESWHFPLPGCLARPIQTLKLLLLVRWLLFSTLLVSKVVYFMLVTWLL